MKLSRKGWIAAGLSVVLTTAALAAGLFSTLPIVGNGSFCGSTVTGTGSLGGITGQGQGSTGSICGQTVPAGPPVLLGGELIPADTGLAGGAPPQTVTIPSSLLANFSGTPRNYLDNGSLNIQQRGTGTVTCAQNAGLTTAAYGPDRFGCSANVAVGAGRTAIVTTAALLPAGFAQVNTQFRTSGALLQPICSLQEIPTAEATALAGKTVTLSLFEAALAGLSADNGNVTTLSIFYGTGSDQGLGTMTASPAITPAWTGIAFAVNQQAITITTTPTRYQVSGTIPATATEVGVAICFTPTATGAGATDGFAWVGAQLEVAPSMTAYEFHKVAFDLEVAQRFFYRITESATTATMRGSCTNFTSSISNCIVPFPVPMFKVPAMTYVTGFGIAIAAQTSMTACTANATSVTATSAAGTLSVLMSCANAAAGGVLGTSTTWGDAGGTGVISASADF